MESVTSVNAKVEYIHHSPSVWATLSLESHWQKVSENSQHLHGLMQTGSRSKLWVQINLFAVSLKIHTTSLHGNLWHCEPLSGMLLLHLLFWLKWMRLILWERQGDKSMKDVCIHSQLERTFITEQAGPVNVFSLHGPIYPPLVSKRSAPSPVKKRHSRGKSSYLPDPPRHAWIEPARRERPGRKGGIVFAINSSRE